MEKIKKMEWKNLLNISSNNKRLLGMLVLVIIVLSIATGGSFASLGQFKVIAYLFPEMGVLALGMMLAMISGGIDLTVVAVADLTGILSCLLIKQIMPENASFPVQILILVITLLASMCMGAVCGIFTGSLISRVGIPAMVATLGASDIILGIAVGITNGSSVKNLPPILYKVVNFELFGLIPGTTIVFIICAAIIAFILNKTAMGFKIYMIGSNKTAARFAGINDNKIIIMTYMISGMLSAVAGLLMCGHFNSARSDFGKSYLTPAILICVLAGVNPNGGSGRISGIVFAVIILQALSSGFSMFPNISDYYKNLIWGVVLIGIMVFNHIMRSKKSFS